MSNKSETNHIIIYETSCSLNMHLATIEKYEKAMKDMEKMMREIKELKQWRHEIEIKSILKKRKFDQMSDEVSSNNISNKRQCKST